MIRRIANVLRHMTAGLLLLMATGVVAEIGIRRSARPAPEILVPATCDSIQSLLQPSDVVHHMLSPTAGLENNAIPPSVARDFRVNADGCRGAELKRDRTGQTYRILVLGDDLICNPWVSEESTLPERLRQFMQSQTSARLEVINGAVPGDCPLLSWLRYRHGLSTLAPDLVILHFDMSDVDDDRRYRRLLMESEHGPKCPNVSLTSQTSPGAAILNTVRHSALASWAIDVSQQATRQAITAVPTGAADAPYAWIADDSSDQRIQIAHALSPLTLLRDAVESSGGRLLVTSSPVLWQITTGVAAPGLTSRCRIGGVPPYKTRLPFAVTEQYCRHERIRFLAVVEAFESSDNATQLFSRSQPVLSEFGLALYAREIGKYLLANPPVHWSGVTAGTAAEH